MTRIAVIIGELFEDSEYTDPAKALRQAGHEIIHAGLQAGQTVHGKKNNTPVAIDLAVQDARVADFDALLIPGGGIRRTNCVPNPRRWNLSGNSCRTTNRCFPSAMGPSFSLPPSRFRGGS